MIAFAVLYFSLMIDAGLFDPLIRGMLRWREGRSVAHHASARPSSPCAWPWTATAPRRSSSPSPRCCPVYQRLGMSRLVLAGIVCLGAGVMNMVPWGGPTARAMAALKLDSSEVFTPCCPRWAVGIVWVLFASYLIGRRERNRLASRSAEREARTSETVPRDADRPEPTAPPDADGRSVRRRPAPSPGPRPARRRRADLAQPGRSPSPSWWRLVLRGDAAAGAVRPRVRDRAAGQPPALGAAAGAAGAARQERRPGHHDDLRGRRLHRHPHRHQDDRRDGRGARLGRSPTGLGGHLPRRWSPSPACR